jgi:hypothetical protein
VVMLGDNSNIREVMMRAGGVERHLSRCQCGHFPTHSQNDRAKNAFHSNPDDMIFDAIDWPLHGYQERHMKFKVIEKNGNLHHRQVQGLDCRFFVKHFRLLSHFTTDAGRNKRYGPFK